MRTFTNKKMIVWSAIISLMLCASAFAQTNLIVDLGTLGGIQSRAMGINSNGQIVGYSDIETGKYHAFLWDGSMHDLGTVTGKSESFAFAINDTGQIVGASTNLGDVTSRAFLWRNATLNDIGEFMPRAINNNGDVVGWLSLKRNSVDWYEHACLWRNGSLTDLGALNGLSSFAYGINNAGKIVGLALSSDEQTTRAFVWNNGAMSDLGTLGGKSGQAYAINNLNQIVGFANAASGTPHGILFNLDQSGSVTTRTDLGTAVSNYSYAYAMNSQGQVVGTNGHAIFWQNGIMTDLNQYLPANTKWVLEAATGINDKGQIVGWGQYNGMLHAFLFNRPPALPVGSVSAASYSGATVAPESLVSSFGTNLAINMVSATISPPPTELGGTKVMIRDSAGNERLAGLLYVSPVQINYQIPDGLQTGDAQITITSGDGTVSTGTLKIAAVSPSLFSADASGTGLAAARVQRVHGDNSQSNEPVVTVDTTTGKIVAVPIDLGPATDQVYLNLFGTGIRKVSNSSAVTTTIGGVSATVTYAGAQGFFIGLDQLNILIPRSLIGRGEVEVLVTVEGKATNLVKIAIR